MNHLAHIFLSGNDNDLMIGNLIADFITGKEKHLCAPKFLRGIQLHYAIDVFTDAHPIVRESTKLLHPFQHKYAPVVVDVFYDFFLAKNWQHYSSVMQVSNNMRDFIDHTYKILQENKPDLPEKLAKPLPNMIKNDWLIQATRIEGQRKVFTMLEKRVRFENNFAHAADNLLQYQNELEKHFNLFFPDLIAHCTEFCRQNFLPQ